MASATTMLIRTINCRCRTPAASLRTQALSLITTVHNPLRRSTSTVVLRVLAVWASFVIGRCAKDVEVAVEGDIDLAAVVAGDLDFVVALLVTDLGAGHAASVGVVERDALGLLDAGSCSLLLRRFTSGSKSHACPDEHQHRDRRSYQQRLYVYR